MTEKDERKASKKTFRSGSGTEEPAQFPNDAGRSMHAILHRPSSAKTPAAAVIFCHGWSGHRLGPHRMFVKMARALADEGILCLRPDFTGRGNSSGRTADGTIQQMIADTCVAIEFMQKEAGEVPVLLLGICSGGKVAIGAATGKRGKVNGLVLWSGEALGSLRNETTNRRKSLFAVKSYVRKLSRLSTWGKIIRGNVNLAGVKKTLMTHETRSADEAVKEENILRRFRKWQGVICFVYGTHDPDTKLAGQNYRSFCDRNRLPYEYQAIENANHSFYSLDSERKVMKTTKAWIVKSLAENF